jgi:hypothetical protein
MSLSHALGALEFDGFVLGQRTQISRANDDGQHALYLNGTLYAWLPANYSQELLEEFIYDYVRARDGE